MKKNAFRVLSLILVAAMLFAFTACAKKVEIRFVDKDGNDIDFGAVVPVDNPETPETPDTPDTPAPVDETTAPADETPAPADETTAPSDETPAPADETTAPAPAEDTTAAPAPAGPTKPTSKEEILDFYKAAVARIKNNAEAGYEKKEYQIVEELKLTGNSVIDGALSSAGSNYGATEETAETQIADKGSNESKDRFPGFTLTDYSKVASATIDTSGTNYKITIVMQTEDTPMSTGSFLTQVTNSVLLWDTQIAPELEKISVIQQVDDVHVIYNNYTITAEITPDGKFVSLDHNAPDVMIQIVSAKVGLGFISITLKDKSGSMKNFCQYRNFTY